MPRWFGLKRWWQKQSQAPRRPLLKRAHQPRLEVEALEERVTPAMIVTVKYSAIDAAIPHPAHETTRVTLKAVVRNANVGHTYRVWWDTNLNGIYTDETSRDVSVLSHGSIPDIGRTFIVPNVTGDTLMNIWA